MLNTDNSSFAPKYYRIYQDLLDKLNDGEFGAGERFPSEYELVKQYGVSRGTVLQAIKLLIQKGYLVREQGKGTFVSHKTIHQDPESLMGFTELMRKHNMRPSGRVFTNEVIPAPQSIRQIMELEEARQVVHLIRVRYGDEEPLIIEQSYFNYDCFEPLLEENLEDSSIYELLYKKTSHRLGEARQTIEATTVGPFEQQHLNLATGTPLLVIKRLIKLLDGTIFQYSEDIYRSDRISFSTVTHKFEDDHNISGLQDFS